MRVPALYRCFFNVHQVIASEKMLKTWHKVTIATLSVVWQWMASSNKSWMPFLTFIWLLARFDIKKLSSQDTSILCTKHKIFGVCWKTTYFQLFFLRVYNQSKIQGHKSTHNFDRSLITFPGPGQGLIK